MTWTPCSAKAAELLSSFLAMAQWRQEPHHVMLACNQAGGLFDRRPAIAGHTTVPGTDMSAGPCQASYGLDGGPQTPRHIHVAQTPRHIHVAQTPRHIHVAQTPTHTCGPDTQTHTCGPDTQTHTCGRDTYMWPRYIHVAQIHTCGPDTYKQRPQHAAGFAEPGLSGTHQPERCEADECQKTPRAFSPTCLQTCSVHGYSLSCLSTLSFSCCSLLDRASQAALLSIRDSISFICKAFTNSKLSIGITARGMYFICSVVAPLPEKELASEQATAQQQPGQH